MNMRRDASVAKFWLDPVELQERDNFSGTEIRRIQRIVEDNQATLLEAWNGNFNR